MRAVRYSLFLALFLAGCGASESKAVAEEKADAVYRERAEGVNEALLDMYSSKFYEHVARDDWARMLRNVSEKLGDYRSHELVNWNVRTGRTELGAGTQITLIYRVVYSNYQSTERLDFFGSDVELVGHQIDSQGLLLGD
jgi:hypothetical protein